MSTTRPKQPHSMEFARRLKQACDENEHVPPFRHGRQTWLSRTMKVSPEAARKWISGLSRPRPPAMKALAKELGVDEAWLALGVTPDVAPKERRARNAMADGAVNVLAGYIQMNGGNPAFPDDQDPRRGYVDLYAIIRGTQFSMHVALAQKISEGVYQFHVPMEYADCTVIGTIQIYPLRCVFLNLTTALMDQHGHRRGGFLEVTVQRVAGEYQTGDDKWPRIHSFRERL